MRINEIRWVDMTGSINMAQVGMGGVISIEQTEDGVTIQRASSSEFIPTSQLAQTE